MSAQRYCSYAPANTYGHECGDPAAQVAVFASGVTADGVFYTGRCNHCLANAGGDNAGLLRVEPESGQSNKWVPA